MVDKERIHYPATVFRQALVSNARVAKFSLPTARRDNARRQQRELRTWTPIGMVGVPQLIGDEERSFPIICCIQVSIRVEIANGKNASPIHHRGSYFRGMEHLAQ